MRLMMLSDLKSKIYIVLCDQKNASLKKGSVLFSYIDRNGMTDGNCHSERSDADHIMK